MEQPKWMVWSLTAWGAVVTFGSSVLPVIGPVIGMELNPMDIASLGEKGTAFLNATFGLIGIVMVLIGRKRATGPATFSKPSA